MRISPPAKSRPSRWSSTSAGARMPSRRPIATALPPARSRRKQEAAQRIAAALAVIADGLGRLDGALTAIETRLETEAVEVAVAVAGKLAPALLAREPLRGDLPRSPRNAFTTWWRRRMSPCGSVPASMTPRRKRSRKSPARVASKGGLPCVSDREHLAAGDCRIEWADGGVNRDQCRDERRPSMKWSAATFRRATPPSRIGILETDSNE